MNLNFCPITLLNEVYKMKVLIDFVLILALILVLHAFLQRFGTKISSSLLGGDSDLDAYLNDPNL